MEVSTIKNIAFPVSDELHMNIKIQAARNSKTIKDYIISLINKDLEDKQEKKLS
jgi:hypothetical protein